MIQQERECYELFRQAILERDADAWAAINERFRPLLVSWARRYGASIYGIECTDIADLAFARAWAAFAPERFTSFPTLPRLLGYLRTCVVTTIIDYTRQQKSSETELSAMHMDTAATPEQLVLAELDRAALWKTALALAANKAEHVALVESFIYDLPPRVIHKRHQQLFPNVAAVYSTKRNLLQRLQRNGDLRRLHEGFVSN
jgi:DNA-directed RNA polymerase specialized sigma24 family protein